MKAFYLVLCFPLLAGVGFGAARSLLSAMYGQKASMVLARESGWFHLLFLSLPLAAILGQGLAEGTLPAMGVRWPAIPHLAAWMAALLTLAAGAVVGVALYVNELVVSFKIRALTERAAPRLAAVVEGQSGRLAGWSPDFGGFMTLSALITGAEELVWRGFLIYFLTDRLKVAAPLAVLAAALLFGINHSYFGLRNVLLKSLDGAVWGALLVATASVFGPVVSHLTFQGLVWRRMRRRAQLAAPAFRAAVAGASMPPARATG